MTSTNSIRAGRAEVEIGINDKITKGLALAEEKLRQFGRSVQMVGGLLAGIGGSALAGLGAATVQFATTGAAINDMSDRTGIAADRLSGLIFAAQQSGSSAEELEVGVRKMQRTLADAASGSETARQAFASIGITMEELAGMTPDEQFARIADGIAAIEDPSARAAAAIEIFGRSGTSLIPMMLNGAKGLAAFKAQADKFGLTVSPEEARAADQLDDSLTLLGLTAKRLVTVIGSALAPTMQQIVDRVGEVVGQVVNWVKANGPLVVQIAGVAAGAVGLGAALIVVGGAISAVGFAVGGLISIMTLAGTVVSGAVAAFGFVASPLGLIVVGVTAAVAALLYFSGALDSVASFASSTFGALASLTKETFDGIRQALAEGDLAAAGRILMTGLRIAWLEGVDALRSQWDAFTTGLVVRVQGAANSVRDVFGDLAAGVRILWGRMIDNLLLAFDALVASAKKGWNNIKALAPGVDPAEMGRQNVEIDRERQASEAALMQARMDRERQIAQERSRSSEALAAQEVRTRDELAGKDAAAAAARQAEIDAARAQLKKDIEGIKKRPPSEPAPERVRPGAPSLEDLARAPDTIKRAADRVSSVGTFSAAAAFGFGAGSTSERIAASTAETAKNTKRIVDQVAGPVRFA